MITAEPCSSVAPACALRGGSCFHGRAPGGDQYAMCSEMNSLRMILATVEISRVLSATSIASSWASVLDLTLCGWLSACHPCTEHVPRWLQCDDYRREMSLPRLSKYDRSKPRHRVPVLGLPRARCCDV